MGSTVLERLQKEPWESPAGRRRPRADTRQLPEGLGVGGGGEREAGAVPPRLPAPLLALLALSVAALSPRLPRPRSELSDSSPAPRHSHLAR